MKKILILFMLIAVILSCVSCGEPDFEFNDYSGNYTIIGYSRDEIIKLDVGIYQTEILRTGAECAPAEIIVYKINEEKYYYIKTFGSYEGKISLSKHLFDEE